MHDEATVRRALELHTGGSSISAIARSTGVSRATVRNWLRGNTPRRGYVHKVSRCFACGDRPVFPELTRAAYSYLLGMYLGDGSLAELHRGVWRLSITLDCAYPIIVEEAATAIAIVFPRNAVRVAPRAKERAVDVQAYSKHWPCLLPQHGAGMKHMRRIELTRWQREILDRHPWSFLRGLIHSDGCRFQNPAVHPHRTYWYPRYQFSNRSADIRALFCEYCERVGVEWRQANRWNISVARRASVELMDRHIGPKR